MDEHKPAGGSPGLVRLQVADKVPLRALYRVHLRHRLLDAVLAQDSQPSIEGRPADLRPESLGDRDDSDLFGVTAGLGDALANRPEVFLDAHLSATIAPNLVPSGMRRCDGKR